MNRLPVLKFGVIAALQLAMHPDMNRYIVLKAVVINVDIYKILSCQRRPRRESWTIM